MGYMGERKNLKVSQDTYEKLDDSKPDGVTWDKFLSDIVTKGEAWDDLDIAALARRLESVEDDLHADELVDMREMVSDVRIDLVNHGLDYEFNK